MISLGIVGCGRIAPKHVQAIVSSPSAKIHAICDINETAMDELAKQIPYPVKRYTSYDEMLASKEISCVCICTPSGLHAPMAIAAAHAKKHVVCEKPMAMNLKEADAMVSASKHNGTSLFVIKQNRYNPPVRKLKDALEGKRFGKLLMGNITVRWCRPQEYYGLDSWRGTKAMDGSVIFNQASHHVDLLLWCMGPVHSVKAYGGILNHDIEVQDSIVAIIKFKNGALGTIEATTCAFPKNLEGSITILGEKGTVKVGGVAVNKMELWEFKEYSNDDSLVFSLSTNPPNVYGFGHVEIYKDIILALQGKGHAPIDGLEGRKSLELIEAIHKSIDTDKEVFL